MTSYNFVIIENKVQNEYLNIKTEEEFFEELWKWTYAEDLWEFIEIDKPDKECLIHYIDDVFISEEMFHNYEDDDLTCYAFEVDDDEEVHTYNWGQSLIDFVLNKIKEKYGKL